MFLALVHPKYKSKNDQKANVKLTRRSLLQWRVTTRDNLHVWINVYFRDGPFYFWGRRVGQFFCARIFIFFISLSFLLLFFRYYSLGVRFGVFEFICSILLYKWNTLSLKQTTIVAEIWHTPFLYQFARFTSSAEPHPWSLMNISTPFYTSAGWNVK